MKVNRVSIFSNDFVILHYRQGNQRSQREICSRQKIPTSGTSVLLLRNVQSSNSSHELKPKRRHFTYILFYTRSKLSSLLQYAKLGSIIKTSLLALFFFFVSSCAPKNSSKYSVTPFDQHFLLLPSADH